MTEKHSKGEKGMHINEVHNVNTIFCLGWVIKKIIINRNFFFFFEGCSNTPYKRLKSAMFLPALVV